jgi:membrane-bound lytic murein transglycosylase B
VGIPLNGSNSTAVITDTDGGHYDGDQTHDRAVGPMQFIPSTWARYAADGNGDGVTDPQNLYDAARAAAVYLCTAGGDLTTDAGIHRAVYAYNHSEAYVAKVLGFATEYRSFLL